MRTLLTSAVVAAVIGLGAGAADAAVATGKIQHVYPRYDRIVLHRHLFSMNSRTFHSVRPHRGEMVRVTYHWAHGHRWATNLKTA